MNLLVLIQTRNVTTTNNEDHYDRAMQTFQDDPMVDKRRFFYMGSSPFHHLFVTTPISDAKTYRRTGGALLG